MTEPAPHGAASSSASDAELLAILAELGREVTSVLDLDELLEKIPQAHLAAHLVHGVLGLPARRGARRAEHRLRRRLSRRNREALHAAGRPGHRRHGRRRAAADPAERRRRRPALPRRGAGRQVAAGGAAAPQGQGDRRAQPAERPARRLHRARRVDPAAVRRPRRAGDRRPPGCSSRSASTPRRWRRWPRSAAR